METQRTATAIATEQQPLFELANKLLETAGAIQDQAKSITGRLNGKDIATSALPPSSDNDNLTGLLEAVQQLLEYGKQSLEYADKSLGKQQAK